MKLTVGSCFSGIGGLEKGLEDTGGFETKWQIENDEYATKVLEKHWPGVKRYADIRDVVRPEPVDVIVGGFPCQDVSLAGKRSGLQGKRTTLWREMFRLVCQIGPRWVVAENVPGLLSSDGGQFMGYILRDLARAGYDAEWDLFSACEIGAPHTRERLFIVANAASTRKKPDTKTIQAREPESCSSGWWEIEPRLDRMASRIPGQMDRLRCLGNAVVPQVAEKIGRMILSYENSRREE